MVENQLSFLIAECIGILIFLVGYEILEVFLLNDYF